MEAFGNLRHIQNIANYERNRKHNCKDVYKEGYFCCSLYNRTVFYYTRNYNHFRTQ